MPCGVVHGIDTEHSGREKLGDYAIECVASRIRECVHTVTPVQTKHHFHENEWIREVCHYGKQAHVAQCNNFSKATHSCDSM